MILVNQVGSLGPGTILDREAGSNQFFYHGSAITLPDQTSVYYLNNFQTDVTTGTRTLSGKPSVTDLTTFTWYNGAEAGMTLNFSDMEPLTDQTFTTRVFVVARSSDGIYSAGLFYGRNGSLTVSDDATHNFWIRTSGYNSITLSGPAGDFITLPLLGVTDSVSQSTLVEFSPNVNIIGLD